MNLQAGVYYSVFGPIFYEWKQKSNEFGKLNIIKIETLE